MADRLAPPSDLLSWLGVSSQPDDRTFLALEVATGWVQGYTGQKLVAVVNDTVSIQNRRPVQRMYLPQRPVTSVSSVVVGAGTYTAATDWTLIGDCLLTGIFADAYLTAWKGRWWYWPEFVTVTYSHGYAVCPQDIRGVVLSAAARIVENPVGVSSHSVGGVSTMFSRLPISSGGLTTEEMKTLESYRDLVVA